MDISLDISMTDDSVEVMCDSDRGDGEENTQEAATTPVVSIPLDDCNDDETSRNEVQGLAVVSPQTDDDEVDVRTRGRSRLYFDTSFGTPEKVPLSSSAIAETAAMITRPLETMADTVEEQINTSLDSSLSCCQWLQELAEAVHSPTKQNEALTSASSPTSDCQLSCDSPSRQNHDQDGENLPYLLQIQSTESSDTAAVPKGLAQRNAVTSNQEQQQQQHEFLIRTTPSLLSDSSSEDEQEDDGGNSVDSVPNDTVDGDATTATTDLLAEDGHHVPVLDDKENGDDTNDDSEVKEDGNLDAFVAAGETLATGEVHPTSKEQTKPEGLNDVGVAVGKILETGEVHSLHEEERKLELNGIVVAAAGSLATGEMHSIRDEEPKPELLKDLVHGIVSDSDPDDEEVTMDGLSRGDDTKKTNETESEETPDERVQHPADVEDHIDCDTDAAMEFLLREMDEYVGENNIRYHEVSPEKTSRTGSASVDVKSLPEAPNFVTTPPRDATKRTGNAPIVTPASPSSMTPLSKHVNDSFESVQEGMEALHTTEVDSDDGAEEFFMTPSRLPKKRLSFADEHGFELEQTRVLDPPAETTGRIVILLLSPSERVFEFLHVECPYDEFTTVQVLVEQLQALATMHSLRYTKFIGLARVKSNVKGTSISQEGEENERESVTDEEDANPLPTLLDSSMLLGEVGFRNCELVLAIPDKLSCSEVVTHAYPLLLNGTIMKALQAGRRSGRGLKPVKSGEQWYKDSLLNGESTVTRVPSSMEENNIIMHKYREWVVVADLAENVVIFGIDLNEYVSNCEQIQQQMDNKEVVLEWVEETMEYCFDSRMKPNSQLSWRRTSVWLLTLLILAVSWALLASRGPEISQYASTSFSVLEGREATKALPADDGVVHKRRNRVKPILSKAFWSIRRLIPRGKKLHSQNQ
jgi:hypothetical protein